MLRRFVPTIAAGLLVVAACSSSTKDECSCFNPGLVVSAGKGDVTAIKLGGTACGTAKVNCADVADNSEFVSGCEQYIIAPTAAGTCTIHVETKSDGPLDAARTIVDQTSDRCCGGFNPSPPESYEIVAAHGS